MKKKIYDFLRGLRKRRQYRRMRNHLRKRVNSRLLGLKGAYPKLTEEEKEEIGEFYKKHGLPLSTYAFHEFYKVLNGMHDPRYLTEDVYYDLFDKRFNDWNAAKYIDDKTLYRLIFAGIPQPSLLGYRQNGFWFNEAGDPISSEELKRICASRKDIFIKQARQSYGGKGVHCIAGNSLNPAELPKDSLVIQEALSQSPQLASINPSSVNTLRVLTFLRKDGTVKICSSILRMGRGGSRVDNASSGGITIGIREDGTLKDVAFSVTGEAFTEHPSSNVRFSGISIPNYDKVLDFVTALSARIPYFRLVSWDVALDTNNDPVLIEANLCDGELDFHQFNNGPVFGDETEAILREALKRD